MPMPLRVSIQEHDRLLTAYGEPAIMLNSPYHPDLPAAAVKAGGRYSNREEGQWLFKASRRAEVEALAREIYGTSDSAAMPECALVDIRIRFEREATVEKEG